MLPEAADEAVHLLPADPAVPDLTLRPQVQGNLLSGALREDVCVANLAFMCLCKNKSLESTSVTSFPVSILLEKCVYVCVCV